MKPRFLRDSESRRRELILTGPSRGQTAIISEFWGERELPKNSGLATRDYVSPRVSPTTTSTLKRHA